MDLRSGVCWELEEQADALIVEMIHAEWGRQPGPYSGDVITRWKAETWHERHVLVPLADSSLYRGLYKREANSVQVWLNSRDGHVRGSRYDPIDHDEEVYRR